MMGKKNGSGFFVYFDGCVISANVLENFDCLPVSGFRTYCLLKNIFKKTKKKNPLITLCTMVDLS